jgi:N-acetyl-alpha-D-glucosaminyl L-malate synthase BshA
MTPDSRLDDPSLHPNDPSLHPNDPSLHAARPLRIAIVAHHALGGSGVMAVEWARLLAGRGHEVQLFRTGGNPRDSTLPRRNSPGTLTQHTVKAPPHPVLDGPSDVTAMAAALIDAHTHATLDIVHIHYALPFALIVPLLRALPNAPRCVVSLHGTDVTGIGADTSYRSAMRLALACADVVTTPSRWLSCEAEATLGLTGTRLLANFVDLGRFAPSASGPQSTRDDVARAFGCDDGTPVVLHASNFRAVKRVGDVVESVRAMPKRARLILVGDGPELAQTLNHARTVLGEDVASIGAVDDPVRYFQQSDAMLLPSSSESFGLAALESLACGTPVVTSNAGGLPEWLTGTRAARLCPVGDISGFATALSDLVFSPVLRTDLREQARAVACRVGDPNNAAIAAEALYTHASP